ncbi:hypothetical protein JCM7686_0294 [Paracoccus aminophilus JCM 7686]|uniref:Uncharacterized protein n=1 Tax=Paracoccus aminophilus JCM 7686 TaxID=1367847 RepID=S5Y7S6_PARAH|nr:hypothetical protein JCM7686_0294 [Paracoccus aminophilus JCM 7686]
MPEVYFCTPLKRGGLPSFASSTIGTNGANSKLAERMSYPDFWHVSIASASKSAKGRSRQYQRLIVLAQPALRSIAIRRDEVIVVVPSFGWSVTSPKRSGIAPGSSRGCQKSRRGALASSSDVGPRSAALMAAMARLSSLRCFGVIAGS